MSDPGYFGGTPAMLPALAPPRRRAGVVLVLSGVLALVLAGGVVATSRVQAQAMSTVHALEEPAPAEDGWGPTYVDDRGRAARWDPCTPIHYVVNPGWIPHKGRADLTEALRRITAASGLQFVNDGDTDEMPSRTRPAYQPGRYGERWAPLLVAWVPSASTDLGLGDGVQGVSMAVAVPGKAAPSLVSGQVALDASRRLAGGFGPGTTDGEVLLHELAHAIGLGHVQDPTQVMYPQATNAESQFGAGDRAGLRALGAEAGCHPAPKARHLRMQP